MSYKRSKVKLFKHQILITVISGVALAISMIGGSYAKLTSSTENGEYNVISVGNLDISYVDHGDGYGDVLSLNGSNPLSDIEGKTLIPYRFSVENTSNTPIDFKIKILNDESIIEADGCSNNLLDYRYIKIQFDNNKPVLLSSFESTGYTIFSDADLIGRSSQIHNIRIWVTNEFTEGESAKDIAGKHFHGKVVIETNETLASEKVKTDYNIGNKVILKDGSSWHVLKNSSKTDDMVTLLADYNLRVDEGFEGEYDKTCSKNNINCSPIKFDEEGIRLDTYCEESVNGCNVYEKNDSTVLTDSSIKTWLETYYVPRLINSLNSKSGTSLEKLTVTLPSAEDIASASGKTFNQTILSKNLDDNFLTTTNYWTKTAAKTAVSNVWYVSATDKNFSLAYANESNKIGIRPVITISKVNIESVIK